MKKQERKQRKQHSQNERTQQPENVEFGEEFTFDEKRQQPDSMPNKERRNQRK
ncbi:MULTISPECIES: hypothetical protein [unclassified Sporosarcina]|uniref:hypothetical protein n=1 Tax=unclassified Sporosarcina TaxID=2647733 RepID=UPI0012DFB147|nr:MULTISPECIES: hypothetical protein [unclassified Sporosarcina]